MIFRLGIVRYITCLLFVFCHAQLLAQGNSIERISAQLATGGPMPEKILSARSIVLYSYSFTPNEIKMIHESMVRTGIDAVAYFESDRIFAGYDVEHAYMDYFTKREIVNVLIFEKLPSETKINITTFNGSESFVTPNQAAWQFSHANLKEALNEVYRSALGGKTKQNFLINEIPEINLSVEVVPGRRIEAFAYDLKVDKLAVPKFGDAALDKELEEVMKNYPFKYELTDPTIPEINLRKQGFFYVLRFTQARNAVAKELLAYDMSKTESAFVSMTYPNGEVKLKTIATTTPIFKFYARKIDSGNVYLGTKWDADTTWQQSLLNFIKSFKAELRID